MRESVKFNIEGLSSLSRLYLRARTREVDFSIKNLASLRVLTLAVDCKIDENIVTRLVDQIRHIETLDLNGNLSYFNLDQLYNLRTLSLNGTIDEEFNFELFENNLCEQLEDIEIVLSNLEEKTFLKLFDGYNFPYLVDFSLRFVTIKRLKNGFINRFPALRRLNISRCEIEMIENGSFSSLEQLCFLDLSFNRIENIDKNTFSELKNLQTLDLRFNKIPGFDPIFVGLRESAQFTIEYNRL